MLSHKKILLALSFVLVFSSFVFAQSEITILPVYNPQHLQVKVSSAGRVLSKSDFITTADKKIKVEAFSQQDGELVIPELSLDIVRGGRKIASQLVKGEADLSNLLNMAQVHDVFRFVIEKVFIRNEKNELELYSNGNLTFLYEFRKP